MENSAFYRGELCSVVRGEQMPKIYFTVRQGLLGSFICLASQPVPDLLQSLLEIALWPWIQKSVLFVEEGYHDRTIDKLM